MDLKLFKITNPLYIGQVGPLIQQFFKRIERNPSVKGISYESLYTYFTNVVQFGGESAEFHVVAKDDIPVAFAEWRILTAPHYGTVFWEYVYNSTQTDGPVLLLGDEFVKYGKKHNAPYYSFTAINDKVAKAILKSGKKCNLDLENTGIINFIGRHNNGK